MRSAQAGDQAAQERILRYLAEQLLPYALGLCPSPREAEGLVADAVSRAYERLDQLSDPDALVPWVRRIMTRLFLDGRRQHRRRRECDLETATLPSTPPPTIDDLNVRRALSKLDRRDQALLALYYWFGFDVAECAAELGVPEGTVKSRLWAARGRLRRDLEEGNE